MKRPESTLNHRLWTIVFALIVYQSRGLENVVDPGQVKILTFRPIAPSREVHYRHMIENIKNTFRNCKIILKNCETQLEKMNQKIE